MSIAEMSNETSKDSAKSMLQIYNTLSKKKETFEPVTPGKVGIYLCGPTVYKEAHIGHMVGPVIFDTIKRYLVYNGYAVDLVVNITDVDDKLIAESNRRGIPMSQVATEMTADYMANLLDMGVDQITHMPRATDNMDEIIKFIEELVGKDYAYAVDGDVFFDVLRDADYGKLTNRSAEDQQGGGGGAAAQKRSPNDFALWKSAKPGEPYWESPWGNGRPGWHIECSAMSRRILGRTFDIHGGGLDLTFPHHENEIAQSESCHDCAMAKYWMHNGLMRADKGTGKVGGKSDREETAAEAEAGKISRSKGAGGLRDQILKHTGERIRFFLMRTHYRSTIAYSDEGLEEAGVALGKFYTLFERYERITGIPFYFRAPWRDKKTKELMEEDRKLIKTRVDGAVLDTSDPLLAEVAEIRTSFLENMDDDFNTGGATSDLFNLLSLINRFTDENKLDEASKRTDAAVESYKRAVETLRELSAILGLFIKKPRQSAGGDDGAEVLEEIMKVMIDLRNTARTNKDFATSDKIRDGLKAAGIVLEDRKDETGWKFE